MILPADEPTYPDALARVMDAARQHVASLGEYGRVSGLVEFYDEAIRVVEAGMTAEETVQRRVA